MSTPLSFCDISARYGQTPAPWKTLEEQTGWNVNRLFLDYLRKVREQSEQKAKEEKEDALMAMIDAMNAPEGDREAIIEKYVERADSSSKLAVQVLLSCLGDRFTSEEADKVQEQAAGEERLEVTEERALSKTDDIKRR